MPLSVHEYLQHILDETDYLLNSSNGLDKATFLHLEQLRDEWDRFCTGSSEERIALPPTDMTHTIWTPYDACDAAATLLHVLNEDRLEN